jgi:acetoacetate decarboxylase
MNAGDISKNALAMPFTNPSYPRGPYRFVNREYLIISYRTDPDALRAVVVRRQNIWDCFGFKLVERWPHLVG